MFTGLVVKTRLEHVFEAAQRIEAVLLVEIECRLVTQTPEDVAGIWVSGYGKLWLVTDLSAGVEHRGNGTAAGHERHHAGRVLRLPEAEPDLSKGGTVGSRPDRRQRTAEQPPPRLLLVERVEVLGGRLLFFWMADRERRIVPRKRLDRDQPDVEGEQQARRASAFGAETRDPQQPRLRLGGALEQLDAGLHGVRMTQALGLRERGQGRSIQNPTTETAPV